MGLIFAMLRNDDQTLKNTTGMEEEVPDEPSVARSEGTTGEEPMGDKGFMPPISHDGPFQEFFTVWLAAYNAANEKYEMLPADDTIYHNHGPATDDEYVHHEQCTKLKILYKGDPCGIAHAINCVFPNDVVQQWDIRTPETWPRNLCSCSLWNKLTTAADTTWLDYIKEPDHDFLAMDSVLGNFNDIDDSYGEGICEPCHTQPTGSTIPDPTQTPDTREYSCNLSTADQLLLVRRTLELWRIADGGDLPYYPDEPPATGWASSVASRKMTRLERASERQKMNSGKESASHVTRNRLVQRFLTQPRHWMINSGMGSASHVTRNRLVQ